MFDPLLDEADARIAKLRAPTSKRAAVAFSPKVENKPQRPFEPQPLPNFDVAEGLEVNLFAENPQLAKPIQMNFDPQGRLWVASSAVYPQIAPGQKASDTILVLEDTNGDGKADKSTVFAEGLFIPTAVEPGDGGVYVGQSTELLHYKDTNGDGKADQRRIVLSGFGTEDTHHTIHTLRWGHNGRLYFNQSIYIRTDTETPHGVVRLKSGGILELRPQSMSMDIFLRGFCNTWGHAFDRFGQSFVTDGCGSQGVSFGIRGATYLTYAQMRRELKSISPGSYPKFCGLEIIQSEHFPPDWQGTLVTCDFRANRIVRFGLEEQGSSYVTKELPDVLRSTNVTFRPIDVKLGPDGALYIADWSNPIIQHGEVDFRDPRRDQVHGRIWRVTAKGRPLISKPNLANAKTEALLNQLLSPNDFNRNQARRVLIERGEKIKPALAKWVQNQSASQAKLEGLWLYQALDSVNAELLKTLLHASDGRIRAAAARVLGTWHDRIPEAADWLAAATRDAHPRARLEAVRAIAYIPTARSAELVLQALEMPMDPFLDYAVWLSINDLAPQWIDAVQSGAWSHHGREKQLEFALKALPPAQAGSVFGKIIKDQVIAKDGSGPWIELIGTTGGSKEMRKLFDQVLKNGFDEAATVKALNALENAGRVRNVKPDGSLNDALKLLGHKSGSVHNAAIRLAGAWKLEKSVPQLAKLAASSAVDTQKAAFDALRDIGGKEALNTLLTLADNSDAKIRRLAVVTAGSVGLDKAMPKITALIVETSEENESLELWRPLLSIRNGSKKIAQALPKSGLAESIAKAGIKAAREGGRNEPELVMALTRAANLDDAERTLTPEEMKHLGDVAAKADPVKGEKIYRRADLACVSCHAIGGAGSKVGPDLTSIGASAPMDYLIESILFPNRKIKEGYHTIEVQTKDEMEYSGIVLRETDDLLVMRDSTGKEVSIPKNTIESRRTGNSLMPSGLVDHLSAEDQADLYKFLSELGKPGPFDASKGNVARAWKLFLVTIDHAQFGTDKLVAGDLSVPGWRTVYSTVSGQVQKEDLQAELKTVANRNPMAAFAAAQLQLASAATVRLKVNGLEKPELWVNGKAVAVNSDASVSLGQGKHSVVVKLDPKTLPEFFRIEASESTFLVE